MKYGVKLVIIITNLNIFIISFTNIAEKIKTLLFEVLLRTSSWILSPT